VLRLSHEHAAVHCGESNRLGPPVGVTAVREKAIDQRLIEFAGAYRVATQFSNRFSPVVRPQRAAVVNHGFRRAVDFC
jgi:Asp-tRNA(Asn)/Glu-tRNA(Gln) amidotransferase A subunit family amidase